MPTNIGEDRECQDSERHIQAAPDIKRMGIVDIYTCRTYVLKKSGSARELVQCGDRNRTVHRSVSRVIVMIKKNSNI